MQRMYCLFENVKFRMHFEHLRFDLNLACFMKSGKWF